MCQHHHSPASRHDSLEHGAHQHACATTLHGAAAHGGCGCHAHSHAGGEHHHLALLLQGLSVVMLALGLWLDHVGAALFAAPGARLAWYVAAYLPVGWPVVRMAGAELRAGEVFNEFSLMVIATIGAFALGEYPEAVAVMLFYAVGEHFQDVAVDRATASISALAGLRPAVVAVIAPDGSRRTCAPEAVQPGMEIEVPAGGRVPVDGTLLGASADFDTAALTGESVPRGVDEGGEVLAGMIAVDRAVRLRATRPYADSALARIMAIVRDAAERKAPAEQFIRRFARRYTPTVVALAVLVGLVPPLCGEWLGLGVQAWDVWAYRALVFLVVSCPCALVVSIPLSYFSAIGRASRLGVLFKGAGYLDALARVNTVVYDKTGTLTTGWLRVTALRPAPGWERAELLRLVAAAEQSSTHPLGRAVVALAAAEGARLPQARDVEERAGRGVVARIEGRRVLVGSQRLMEEEGVAIDKTAAAEAGAHIWCAADGRCVGRIDLADEARPEAAATIDSLRRLGVEQQVVLSGDRAPAVEGLASRLDLERWHADLLPADKVKRLEQILGEEGRRVAYVGDGINDAPALALSHVGIAMGAGSSDAAVASADVVVQSERLDRIAAALRLARSTRALVWTNVALALGIKVAVLALDIAGHAPLWLAVLADTGVALLCVAAVFVWPAASRALGRGEQLQPAPATA